MKGEINPFPNIKKGGKKRKKNELRGSRDKT
jgi:hypothetical protein